MKTKEILQKLREIEDTVEVVEKHLPPETEEFLHLGLVKDGIYKRIEHAIENVIDICNMLNSNLSLGIPADDEDIVRNLEINKVLSKKIIAKVRTMKGFRNILVHRYGTVDDELAFDLLNNNLSDFHLFSEEVQFLLKKL